MNKDFKVLRELANQYAEIAALPIQREKIELWKQHNALKRGRPLVMIDQLPWNELNKNDELTLFCEEPFHRALEWTMRSRLYKWRHFPVNMVIDPFIEIPRFVSNTMIGPEIDEDISMTDLTNGVVSHHYHDLLSEPENLRLIRHRKILVNPDGDSEKFARAGHFRRYHPY